MGEYEQYLLTRFSKAVIQVHEDWAPATGHVADSQHYLGKAADFHVTGIPVVEAWLALERFPRFMGLGFYPNWKPLPGFHADVRVSVPYRQRWARYGSDYVAFDLSSILKMKEDE
jgi:hypothetical protein